MKNFELTSEVIDKLTNMSSWQFRETIKVANQYRKAEARLVRMQARLKREERAHKNSKMERLKNINFEDFEK